MFVTRTKIAAGSLALVSGVALLASPAEAQVNRCAQKFGASYRVIDSGYVKHGRTIYGVAYLAYSTSQKANCAWTEKRLFRGKKTFVSVTLTRQSDGVPEYQGMDWVSYAGPVKLTGTARVKVKLQAEMWNKDFDHKSTATKATYSSGWYHGG
ncbi:MAG: hypothetical protein HOY71_18115 [Nonomuraea sp.]|nr:hypothetical protein [Nonomuraea sp.]